MALYSYKARDGFGRLFKGVQSADGEEQLSHALKERDLFLVSASETKQKKQKTSSVSFGSPRIKQRDIIHFSSYLSIILSAGIPIISGLQDLAVQWKRTKFSGIISKIIEDITEGSLLHEAFSRHTKVFGETYIYMIKAGESSGSVPKVLKELARFMEWQEELLSNIKKMSIYPVVVLSALGVLVGLLLSFAFPRIAKILVGMKVPLPLSTRMLMGISNIFSSYWYIIIFVIFGGFMGILLMSQMEKGRVLMDRIKLRIPVIGELIRKVSLSRFTRHLSLLMGSGVGIIEAFTIVEKVVGNRVISEAIRTAKNDVETGLTITESLQKTAVFPPMVIKMIHVGETTGTLTDSLDKVSSYYDQEVPATVKKIFSIMEPALIMFLAFMVLVIALSIYLPIYKSISMIGK